MVADRRHHCSEDGRGQCTRTKQTFLSFRLTGNSSLRDCGNRQPTSIYSNKDCFLYRPEIGIKMFYTCGPNEAMVVSGYDRTPPLMIAGGSVFVLPCIQKIQRITLNILTLNVKSDKVYTCLGVPVSVTGVAQVKIQGQNKEMLATACQMFMGKSEAEISNIALETLEGHQRTIIAHLTVEEIYQDRMKLSEQVFKVASSDLVNMGIGIVSYTLKDVYDDQDYLHSLGKARTAQVQRDARIGEAQYKRDAVMKEAHAMQEKVSAQYKNEIEMAKSQRDYELKKAAYDVEVNTKKAESEMAYQLQVAKTKQRIEEEKMQVQVVERTQQITLQEQEITRKEKELEAKVKKPAEAEKYRLERLAEAYRLQLIMEAEAEAESIRMKGEAEAFALEAKGRAEAQQMAKKAEAFKQYKEGAMVDMLLEKLPLMAEEISKPLSEVQKVTMVSSGGSEVGAAKLAGEVLDIMTRLPMTVEKLTGIDISQATGKTMRVH
ncbi:flotillin-1b isoform X2 [Micropterus salmoides]|uniref:flotillin-1b isoform X2 n=1 Tax=Micropterus salmoides TaxID=27706 RepID=UPI0018EA38B2|nr:flotillin-1b isoform X2 [Micropterus salmoides]